MKGNLKGLSPLLATIILIALVVAVGSLTLDWAVNLHNAAGSDVRNKTEGCNSVALVIERVYLDNNTQIGRIIVRNSGFEADTISSVSIVNQKGITGSNHSVLPVSLPKGAQLTLEVNISGVITTCGNFSKAFINTHCGISADYGGSGQAATCV